MRIALVTDGIWPYVMGGMQKHSYYLCKYFALNKIRVDLYHYNQSELDISSLSVFTPEEQVYIRSIIVPMPNSARFPGHYIWDSYRYSKEVYKLIEPEIDTYDLIYTKGFAGWHLINQKYAGKISCAPIAVKFHGYEMFQKAPDWFTKWQHLLLLRRPVKRLSLRADLVFSYGGKITELIKSLGVEEDQIIELPSGVESQTLVEKPSALSHPIQFLFLGRYERRKGIEELNIAITELLKLNGSEKYQFNFVGPIPEDRRLKHSQVLYFGELRDKQQLQTIVRDQDILLCPSWSEGLPNVILEAMAAGLAVVATDVGASAVLVNENTGWLLPDSSPEGILSKLIEIGSLPAAQIETKKLAALNHIREGFTWEILFAKLMTALAKKAGGRFSQAQ
jgi:glycosyltransferase involved in cell wall biosynthesis